MTCESLLAIEAAEAALPPSSSPSDPNEEGEQAYAGTGDDPEAPPPLPPPLPLPLALKTQVRGGTRILCWWALRRLMKYGTK